MGATNSQIHYKTIQSFVSVKLESKNPLFVVNETRFGSAMILIIMIYEIHDMFNSLHCEKDEDPVYNVLSSGRSDITKYIE